MIEYRCKAGQVWTVRIDGSLVPCRIEQTGTRVEFIVVRPLEGNPHIRMLRAGDELVEHVGGHPAELLSNLEASS